MRPAERIRLDMDSLHKHFSTQPPSGGAGDVSNRGRTALPISLEQPRTWQTTPLTHGAVHLRGFLCAGLSVQLSLGGPSFRIEIRRCTGWTVEDHPSRDILHRASSSRTTPMHPAINDFGDNRGRRQWRMAKCLPSVHSYLFL
ncbi:uncharacterized protein B0T23DRAFT_421254 [Neurospora hispaniola]|uniref:Uncharacterized protein n=1 Tax=Neurospora hispaniola TaxID=588809 RepID=A0AAJ0I602_9PEZI|nr:hypothetical protein B0T23DRAFT_421254 [Neurospora hispaniola]